MSNPTPTQMQDVLRSIRDLNPYMELDPNDLEKVYRMNSIMSREDYQLIQSVCPEWGVMQTTINLLLKSIADELRATGITTYNPVAYRQLLSRRTHFSTHTNECLRHDVRATVSVHSSTAPAPSESANTPVNSKKRSSRQRPSSTSDKTKPLVQDKDNR